MQDSLEDYIRLVNNTKQNTVGNLNSKEKVISWEKKQQYENYALKIIEFMIDGRLQPQVFVKSLNFINQDHYQDIVEERAVTKLCGYPICGKRLPPMPKKQFHISTKQNKIYDITNRKLFCCNYCYQASDFIKKQIDTSPLWTRRPEDFPRFILLDQNEILRPGIEIDHGLVKLPVDHNFTSINSFTEACLDEAEEMEYNRLMQERDEDKKDFQPKPKSILKKKKPAVNKDRIEEEDENPENNKESDGGDFRRNVGKGKIRFESKVTGVEKQRSGKDENPESNKGSDGGDFGRNVTKGKIEFESKMTGVEKLKDLEQSVVILQKLNDEIGIRNVEIDENVQICVSNELKDNICSIEVKIETDALETADVNLSVGIGESNQNLNRLEIETVTQESLEMSNGKTCETEEQNNEIEGNSVELIPEKLEVEEEKCVELIVEDESIEYLQKKVMFAYKCKIEGKTVEKSLDSILNEENSEETTSLHSDQTLEIDSPIKELTSKNVGVKEGEESLELHPDQKAESSGMEENSNNSKNGIENSEMEKSTQSIIEKLHSEERDKKKLETFLEKLQVEAKCKIQNSTETNVKKLKVKLLNPIMVPNVDEGKKSKITVKPEYSELSISRRKVVRFETSTPMEPSPPHRSISKEEITEFKEYLDAICKSMGVTPKTIPTPNEKPVEISEAKMKLVIEKVNAAEASRNKCVQLIETNENPESRKTHEMPKYAHRIAEKVRIPEEKPVEINEAKMKHVIEKVNATEASRNKHVQLIETNENPESKKTHEMPKYAHRIAEKVRIPEEKPVEINEAKMKHVIEKVNATEASRNKHVQLIETNENPESKKTHEMPKYAHRIAEKVRIPEEKPVEINEAKMKHVIEKVNATDASRNKRVQLIETNENPESKKTHVKSVNEIRKYAHLIAEKVRIPDENLKIVIDKVRHPEPLVEMPKYAHRIVEKVKTPEEDQNLKVIIEKVKNLKINSKNKKEDKLKEVLQKIKRKEEKSKGSILINTSINPESPEVPKKKQTVTPKPVDVSPALEKIRTTLIQWLTLESYIFIHGEARIKRILNEETLEDYFEQLKIAELETTKQVKYMNICKKLQLREMAEEKFDGVLLNTSERRKPLPDYSQLKEESKDMDLKVKAFFVGSVYEKEDPNFKSRKGDDGGGGEESPAVLPMVDAGSQNVVRKKIFINAVSKYIQVHIKELELDDNVLIEVQNMIKTFKFEADNIIFKPQMWNIIGYVLIIMMSCKCEVVKSKLAMENANTYRNLIFSKYYDANGFLQQVLHIVESVEVYVKNYIVSD